MLKAEVYITLKETIADPQGLTIKHALESLEHKGIKEVRYGKMVTLKLDIKDKAKAQTEVEKMCKELLTNPIIEDYKIKIE